jgi:predicted RNase H-like HicB family nuclease
MTRAISSTPTVPVTGTLTEYLRAAMAQAQYELVEEDGTFFGTIPGLPGLWGHGPTEAACRLDLQSALEDWIVFSLVNRRPIPVIDGIEVRADPVA